MTHTEFKDLGILLTGLFLLPALPLIVLAGIGYRWPHKAMAGMGLLLLLLQFLCWPLNYYMVRGTHFNETGLLLSPEGNRFADGCFIDGFTLAMHNSGHPEAINAGLLVLMFAMLFGPILVGTRKSWKRRRALIEAARQADEDTGWPQRRPAARSMRR